MSGLSQRWLTVTGLAVVLSSWAVIEGQTRSESAFRYPVPVELQAEIDRAISSVRRQTPEDAVTERKLTGFLARSHFGVPSHRADFVRLLAESRAGALPVLEARLRTGDARQRRSAITALSYFNAGPHVAGVTVCGDARELVTLLAIRSTNDAVADNRVLAIGVGCGSHQFSEAGENGRLLVVLEGLLEDDAAGVRESAARCLVRLGHRDRVPDELMAHITRW